MSITKESRLISANSQEWEKIKDILGNRVPRNTFDPFLYVNSIDMLKHIRANSFKKLLYDTAISFFLKLAHEVGLDFSLEGDIIKIDFNSVMNKDNNYSLFIHHIRMNAERLNAGKEIETTESVDSM